MTVSLSVDPDQCRGCGACVQECVGRVAVTGDNHVDPTDARCERCLRCYAVCPSGAVKLSGPFDRLADPDAWREVRPEAMESFLAYRRSTRRFQARPIPDEVLARVVAAGRHVPSGGNRHSHRITVVTDAGVKQKLLDRFLVYYGRLGRLIGSPLVQVVGRFFLNRVERAFLSDPKYGQTMKMLLDRFEDGEDPVFYGAPAVLIVHTPVLIPTPQEDAILSGFAMVLMAQSLGLGTCFVSLAQKGLSADKHCKALVGIPPADYIHAVVVMGYPDVAYLRPVPKPARPVAWAVC